MKSHLIFCEIQQSSEQLQTGENSIKKKKKKACKPFTIFNQENNSVAANLIFVAGAQGPCNSEKH